MLSSVLLCILSSATAFEDWSCFLLPLNTSLYHLSFNIKIPEITYVNSPGNIVQLGFFHCPLWFHGISPLTVWCGRYFCWGIKVSTQGINYSGFRDIPQDKHRLLKTHCWSSESLIMQNEQLILYHQGVNTTVCSPRGSCRVSVGPKTRHFERLEREFMTYSNVKRGISWLWEDWEPHVQKVFGGIFKNSHLEQLTWLPDFINHLSSFFRTMHYIQSLNWYSNMPDYSIWHKHFK